MSADRLALQIKKRSCRVLFSGILFHKLDIVPVRNEANVLTVVLPGVAESQLFRDLSHFLFHFAAQRKLYVAKLVLCQHIQHIALILAVIQRFFQKIPAGHFVIFNEGIVSGGHILQSLLFGKAKQFIELHIPVTINAWIRCPARLICSDELSDDLVPEVHGKIQHFIGNIQLKRHLTGVVDILLRAAGMELTQADVRVAVKTHGCSLAAISLLTHQPCRDRAVHTAAHCNQGTLFSIS